MGGTKSTQCKPNQLKQMKTEKKTPKNALMWQLTSKGGIEWTDRERKRGQTAKRFALTLSCWRRCCYRLEYSARIRCSRRWLRCSHCWHYSKGLIAAAPGMSSPTPDCTSCTCWWPMGNSSCLTLECWRSSNCCTLAVQRPSAGTRWQPICWCMSGNFRCCHCQTLT